MTDYRDIRIIHFRLRNSATQVSCVFHIQFFSFTLNYHWVYTAVSETLVSSVGLAVKLHRPNIKRECNLTKNLTYLEYKVDMC